MIRPSPIFGDSPCLIEFSTSGCRSMLGTTMSRRVGDRWLFDMQLRPEADRSRCPGTRRSPRAPRAGSRSAPGCAAAGAAAPTASRSSIRAVSGCDRISDEIEVSVLKRKCGLIWLASASSRAAMSSFSCSCRRCSMRALFQILIGIATHRTVAKTTSTYSHAEGGAEIEDAGRSRSGGRASGE